MKTYYLSMLLFASVATITAQTFDPATLSEEAALLEFNPTVGEGLAPAGYDGFNTVEVHDEIGAKKREDIWLQIHRNITDLKAKGIIPEAPNAFIPGDGFRYPLKLSVGDFVYNWNAFYWNSNFVDENPAAGAVLDYNCGTRTYDMPGYNHQGQDIALYPYAWNLVYGNYAQVVAAQGGWITFKQDGNFDMNCGFGGGDWNAVYLMHSDGSITWYGHMKSGSLTAKPVGAWVNKGEYLGVVASSGQSTGPHLHFEVYDALGNLVDPNLGPCNAMGGMNWWKDPKPYYQSKINAIYTHCAPPVFMPCPSADITNICDTWYPGSLVHFFSYFTETLAGQRAYYRILKPDGSIWADWNYAFPVSYLGSYWYWTFTLPPGNLGVWSFLVHLKGKTLVYYFQVINPLDPDGEVARVGETNRIYWPDNAAFSGASFEIEAAGDTTQPQLIAALQAGSTNADGLYEWYDGSDARYYRIRTHHANGQTFTGQWLEALRTEPEATAQGLQVFPVPTGSFLQILGSRCVAGTTASVTVQDLSGRILIVSELPVYDGGLIQVDVAALSAGTYLVQVQSSAGSETAQFIKQ